MIRWTSQIVKTPCSADLPYTTPGGSGRSYQSYTTPCPSTCSIKSGLL